LDVRQQRELFLTAAQTLLAVVMMLDLSLPWYGALILFGLFVAQFVWPAHLVAFALIYFALSVGVVVYRRHAIHRVLRDVRSLLRAAP
ncbi:MAG: hypothetical protein M3315_15675, partial [Actinomycetota bacterium]|nr:hypothetical protein [Actinomycetota bacterium]